MIISLTLFVLRSIFYTVFSKYLSWSHVEEHRAHRLGDTEICTLGQGRVSKGSVPNGTVASHPIPLSLLASHGCRPPSLLLAINLEKTFTSEPGRDIVPFITIESVKLGYLHNSTPTTFSELNTGF